MEQKDTRKQKCSHCGNISRMDVKASFQHKETTYDDGDQPFDSQSDFMLMLCPACDKPIFLEELWHDGMDPFDGQQIIVLYPQDLKLPSDLPVVVQSAYTKALKVRGVDPNAYAVMLGRVLDKMCEDRGAVGKTLNEKLTDLASKGEIPQTLAQMAHDLRHLRNLGAHADLGDLEEAEVPFLDELCRAVLEYVYSAPALLRRVQEKLDELKASKTKISSEKTL